MTNRKIALIGSAPSSVALAPWDDESWEIWGCSPGAYPHAKRADCWFEIHEWKTDGRPRFTQEYIDFMNKKPKHVFMQRPAANIANSRTFPVWEVIAEFGPWYWSSTISYMMAYAILQEPAEIGMWGIDMAAQEEWQDQRHHLQTLIDKARERGIRVSAAPESDILRPGKLYGYCESDPIYKKLKAREAELRSRHQQCVQLIEGKTRERLYLEGAIDDLLYMIKTWSADPVVAEMAAGRNIADLRQAQHFINEASGEQVAVVNGKDHSPIKDLPIETIAESNVAP